MPNAEWHDDNAMSFFTLGTTLLRNRWRILAWGLISAAIAAAMVLRTPPVYVASASFIPQGQENARSSGVASLAGQLGISVSAGGSSLSPEFYAKLLKSRALLTPIVRQTFVIAEQGGRQYSFVELVGARGSAAQKEERALKDLADMINVNVVRPSGVVEYTVTTIWRSVSLALSEAIMERVNEYNQLTRRGQAEAERRFVEERVAVASAALRQAEDRLARFLVTNRQFGNSPELGFERDRLQREVDERQEIVSGLRQALEEVRIREVRDTPVVTAFETPSAPSLPAPRGRGKRIIFGFGLGAFIGVLIALTSGMVARRKEEGDTEAEVFVGTLGEVKGEILRPLHWVRRRAPR